MKQIECRDGTLVWVDDEDWETYHSLGWRNSGNGVRLKRRREYVYLHRLIIGAEPGMWVGFMDRDKLNCTKANLFTFWPGDSKRARQQKELDIRQGKLRGDS